MEGLIPLVYKAIKRTSTRRKYDCLSSGAPQSYNYNIDDFYIRNQVYDEKPLFTPEKVAGFEVEHKTHRRNKSVGDFSGRLFSPEEGMKGPRLSKEIVGFRSHRAWMFSCISGHA